MILDMVGQEIKIGDYVARPYEKAKKYSLQIGLVTNIIDRTLVLIQARYVVVPRTRRSVTKVFDWRIVNKKTVRVIVYEDYSDRIIKVEVPERVKEIFTELIDENRKIGIVYKKYSEVSQE